MTSSRVIEEEHGTWTGHAHPHNGYFAGRFVPTAAPLAALGDGTVRSEAARMLPRRTGVIAVSVPQPAAA